MVGETAPWINTILLIFILWFQWNRNKTLSDRIDHQTKLVQDTKSVVTQQATALESQAKVVETAVRYSEAFDPSKFEAVVRQKIEIESSEKLANLEKKHKTDLSDKDKEHKDQIKETFSTTAKNTGELMIQEYLMPTLETIMKLMIRVPADERTSLIAELPDSLVKDHLINISEKINEEYNKALGRALT